MNNESLLFLPLSRTVFDGPKIQSLTFEKLRHLFKNKLINFGLLEIADWFQVNDDDWLTRK